MASNLKRGRVHANLYTCDNPPFWLSALLIRLWPRRRRPPAATPADHYFDGSSAPVRRPVSSETTYRLESLLAYQSPAAVELAWQALPSARGAPPQSGLWA